MCAHETRTSGRARYAPASFTICRLCGVVWRVVRVLCDGPTIPITNEQSHMQLSVAQVFRKRHNDLLLAGCCQCNSVEWARNDDGTICLFVACASTPDIYDYIFAWHNTHKYTRNSLEGCALRRCCQGYCLGMGAEYGRRWRHAKRFCWVFCGRIGTQHEWFAWQLCGGQKEAGVSSFAMGIFAYSPILHCTYKSRTIDE